MRHRYDQLALAVAGALACTALGACGDDAAGTGTAGGGGDGATGATTTSAASTTGASTTAATGTSGGGGDAPLDVAISFEARVGGEAFDCGSSYAGLGKDGSDVSPVDFRFYVHDVRLLRSSDGAEVAVDLEQDGIWQYQNVALLDFEDASSACANGTAELHGQVRGTVPAGDYDGVVFKVGVPFELNHTDVSVAPSPLNVSSLSWSWNGGRLFLAAVAGAKKDDATMNAHFVHLGSTGCQGDAQAGGITSCDQPNRPEYTLAPFNPVGGKIVADFAAIFAASDLENLVGCHSFPGKPECMKPFEFLGIKYPTGELQPETQTVFHAE